MTFAPPVSRKDAAMSLKNEMETFRRELQRLLATPENRGKYALIHNDRVESIEPTLDAALAQGYKTFGLSPFMVKQIVDEEPIYFTRDVVPCQS
jgi:hypothetical protein